MYPYNCYETITGKLFLWINHIIVSITVGEGETRDPIVLRPSQTLWQTICNRDSLFNQTSVVYALRGPTCYGPVKGHSLKFIAQNSATVWHFSIKLGL